MLSIKCISELGSTNLAFMFPKQNKVVVLIIIMSIGITYDIQKFRIDTLGSPQV